MQFPPLSYQTPNTKHCDPPKQRNDPVAYDKLIKAFLLPDGAKAHKYKSLMRLIQYSTNFKRKEEFPGKYFLFYNNLQ